MIGEDPPVIDLDELDFSKSNGLIPVVVQDYLSREILMVAYANREALARTIETGLAHFWSRSRRKIWLKGETSGSVMKVVEILADCDGDAVIYRVIPSGPACHTGSRSCFFRKIYRRI